MYCEYFGFKEKPFNITPDPDFLYLSPGHEEMLAAIIYGIQEYRGLITIVGMAGTGKTTLLKAAREQLDKSTRVAHVLNSDVTFNQLLLMVLVELGRANADEKLTKVQALQRLNDFTVEQHTKGGNVALLIDEAQNLDRRNLENLRLLSNLETTKHKLIQIVLSGTPELDNRLNQPQLQQLKQRVSLRQQINPLNEKETNQYIEHRLSRVNYNGPDLFSRKARQLIWQHSGGVPRKINILCDNALLFGYGMTVKKIGTTAIEETIKDLGWQPALATDNSRPPIISHPASPHFKKTASHTRMIWAAIAFVAALVFGFWLLDGNGLDELRKVKSAFFESMQQMKDKNLPDTSVPSSDKAGQ